jgi:hypothetical protein
VLLAISNFSDLTTLSDNAKMKTSLKYGIMPFMMCIGYETLVFKLAFHFIGFIKYDLS